MISVKYGSGNVGATNALRVLGRGAGITVLLLDVLKGFIAVTVLGGIFSLQITLVSREFLRILLGIACILGHNWTIFLGFKGGKGIATTLGVLLGLAMDISGLRVVLLLLVLTWFLVFLPFRIVSLASLVTALALPLYLFLFKQSALLITLGITLSLLVIWRHRANLRRLLQGKEPRLQFKKPPQKLIFIEGAFLGQIALKRPKAGVILGLEKKKVFFLGCSSTLLQSIEGENLIYLRMGIPYGRTFWYKKREKRVCPFFDKFACAAFRAAEQ